MDVAPPEAFVISGFIPICNHPGSEQTTNVIAEISAPHDKLMSEQDFSHSSPPSVEMAEDNNTQILKQLKRATEGLLFMSESDYPFEIVQWEGLTDLTDDFLCKVSGEPEDCHVEEMKIEDFLTAERYRNIVQVLSENLTDTKAYKVGRINMPVYLVGKSAVGTWLGVSTRVVQT